MIDGDTMRVGAKVRLKYIDDWLKEEAKEEGLKVGNIYTVYETDCDADGSVALITLSKYGHRYFPEMFEVIE